MQPSLIFLTRCQVQLPAPRLLPSSTRCQTLQRPTPYLLSLSLSLSLRLTLHLCIYLATPLTNKHLIPLFGLGLQNIFSAPCISPMGLGKIFTITQLGTWKNSTISSHMYISKEKEKLTTRYNTSPETLLPPAHRCRCLHHRCSRRR